MGRIKCQRLWYVSSELGRSPQSHLRPIFQCLINNRLVPDPGRAVNLSQSSELSISGF
jgi:hypothetical protein